MSQLASHSPVHNRRPLTSHPYGRSHLSVSASLASAPCQRVCRFHLARSRESQTPPENQSLQALIMLEFDQPDVEKLAGI